MRLERNAPAKINLTLEVLGRREDGYHEIASVMHTLSLCDTLVLHLPDAPTFNAAHGAITITVEESTPCTLWDTNGGGHDAIPTDSRNLVWKAVAAFARDCSRIPPLFHGVGELWANRSGVEGWHATLIKRIPTQGGLGGGSSDAATALKLLAEWAQRWDITPLNLHALATHLGADVAFFLNGACAHARGKGEILEPLPPLPPFWWVLAKPPKVSVPTGWAYAQLVRGALEPNARAPRTERLIYALQCGAIHTPHDLAPLLHNDFDEPILKSIPDLRDLRQRMEHAGALKVLLCGSGAAQAVLCESQPHAENLAHILTQQGYWAVTAQTV